MDHKEAHHLRLYVLAALFFIVAAVYIGVLYDTQVNNYDYYYASSVRSIARSETVEAARGNITDRNGKVLVSSRSSYNLTFDASLLEKDEDANESLLRLLQLCQSRGINWVDSLPISRSAPFAYTIDSLDSAARSRFLTYLKDLDEAANALAAYLLEHPALLETTDEEGNRENPADDILADEELDQAGKAQALLEELTSSQLTGAMLEGSGLSATRLIALMRKDFGLSASFSVEEAQLVLGVQYEIRSRNLARTDAYVLAEDIDAELISLLNDGDYAGAKITPSSVREYETTYGAHILGYLGKINDSAEKEALGEGYNWNDYVGKDGVEAAFESHLKGTDGTRVVSLNEDGKIDQGAKTLSDHGDLTVIGNTSARYHYGINVNLNWNGIGISTFWQGVAKKNWYPRYDSGYFWGQYNRPFGYMLKAHTGSNVYSEELDNWDTAYWPRYSAYQTNESSVNRVLTTPNDRYMQDVSYIRLKNLTVDYTFPAHICRKMRIKGLKVYVSGENLWTSSPMFKYCDNYDPEVINAGDSDFRTAEGDGYSYPMLRTVTLGLNLTF